mgnify:FL=1
MKPVYTLALVSIVVIAGVVYFTISGNDSRISTDTAARGDPPAAVARAPSPELPTIAPVGASLLDGLGDHRMV